MLPSLNLTSAWLRLALPLVGLCLIANSASAVIIVVYAAEVTGNVTTPNPGQYHYEYTLKSDAPSIGGSNLTTLVIPLLHAGDVFNIQSRMALPRTVA